MCNQSALPYQGNTGVLATAWPSGGTAYQPAAFQNQYTGTPGTQTDVNPTTYGMSACTTESCIPESLYLPIYTPGYLRTQIGKLMRVEFLIGNSTTDRVGTLSAVGASYIILDSLEAQSRIVCDLFSIKFITIIDNPSTAAALLAAMR